MDLSRRLIVLPLFCMATLLGGCEGAVAVDPESGAGCTPFTSEEAARVKSAIQTEIETSAELIAFHAFRESHGDAIADVQNQALYAKYLLTNGQWEPAEATTGTTSFVFEEGATLTVDVAGEESASLHIETPDFTYLLSAEVEGGYPAGEVKSASLDEWGAGKGVSAEAFGSREKVFLRFPGGNWEETQVDGVSTLALTYAMPQVQAKIWKKNTGSMETVEVTLNGTDRCSSAEPVLSAMFPDVWTLLKLQ